MTVACKEQVMCDEYCPASGDIVSYHTQLQLNGLLEIPAQKPPMEQIFNTIHQIDCWKFTEIIVKKPPGKKVLVVGNVMVGVEYIADVLDQKVHFAHWNIPFQALIKNGDGSLLGMDFDINEYVAHVCVEMEQYEEVDSRTISKQLVLLVWLQKKDN